LGKKPEEYLVDRKNTMKTNTFSLGTYFNIENKTNQSVGFIS